SAHSRAASSAADKPAEWGSARTAPVNGSTSGRQSTHLRQAAITSRAMEDDAVAAFGVGPRDGALDVADEVAPAALEALLVVEEDAAGGGGHEEVGRARHDARLRR